MSRYWTQWTVWTVLIVATVVSWLLAEGNGIDSISTGAAFAIIIVAFVKVRLVGLHFMELKAAPIALRAAFEAYIAAWCTVVIGFYLFA